jgi:hypothetical protein
MENTFLNQTNENEAGKRISMRGVELIREVLVFDDPFIVAFEDFCSSA